MKNSIIIVAIIIIAVVIIGAFAALTMMNTAGPTQNISDKGTKLNLKNNNNQYWQHMDIVVENVTLKNGTVQNFYIEAWVKPGENLTIDLSNLFGYGNERLPTNYTIKPKVWGGMFDTNNTTSTFDMVLMGWSNTLNPPSNVPRYNATFNNMPVVPLPPKITGNMFYWNTTIPLINAMTSKDYPHDDRNEIMFTEINMTVNSDGNIIMVFSVPPTLCSTIAHIISD
jgi:archaellin